MKVSHETIVSYAALALSLFALVLTCVQLKETRKATKAAEVSAAAAQKANQIAIGGTAEVAVAIYRKGAFEPSEKPANLMLLVHNRSDLTFSGVIIKAIPLDGLTYPLSTAEAVKEDLKTTVVKVDLLEGLGPDGTLQVNLGAVLASNIKTNYDAYELRNKAYKASYNVIVSPIKQGDIVGSRGGEEDRDMATVEFTPEQFAGVDAEGYLKAAIGSAWLVQ